MNRYAKDFPILNQEVNGHPLVYLDSSATSQKPIQVIEAVEEYYKKDNSNVHRGFTPWALGPRRITKGPGRRCDALFMLLPPKRLSSPGEPPLPSTWSLSSYARTHLSEGDEILLSPSEHHSNLIPWQQVAKVTGATAEILPSGARWDTGSRQSGSDDHRTDETGGHRSGVQCPGYYISP